MSAKDWHHPRGAALNDTDCIFCRITAGEAEAKIVYRDDMVTAFHDEHPVAPVHILIVPNRHIDSVNEIVTSDEPGLGKLITIARQLAYEFGVENSGFRLVINTGRDAGQSVFHLHLHLIAGMRMPFRFD